MRHSVLSKFIYSTFLSTKSELLPEEDKHNFAKPEVMYDDVHGRVHPMDIPADVPRARLVHAYGR